MTTASAPDADALAALLGDFKRELESLPSARRLTDADAEGFYALAYREFSRARYEEALRLFQLLLVYRPTNTVYLLGTALCLQRLRRYGAAVAVFAALRFLDPRQPSHTLAVAECQLLCHDHPGARETLARVIDYCVAHQGNEPVRARAQAMLELMRSQHVSIAA